ncbi:Holliday junction branch migration protein RuvA [Balneolaceae bacterium YR4-1]|uniref:Holliday junction branch migration complex subunit RuvA n=1 Tax=Halalkalibaculum roseum TaxID=2709311 RepID=A0A6M1SZK1_9BACT|nr:Holliday junction branch migration protein RuvA [Halalkalibaculum roseum]NGP77818.1 Holliday junction branch migration protein RuvA [Halalkalibaculum roseum]
MIAYLKGTLAKKASEAIIVDVHDVGYEVEISSQTFDQLPAEGKDLKLLIHHHITDNDQRLFGFFSSDEKELFELLNGVKGVGPKLGLKILSGLPAPDIIQAIVQADKTALSQISGIGKKTAERMILELKDKIGEIATTAGTAPSGSVSGNLKDEAISALESLGFKKRDAEKAVVAAARENDAGGDVQLLIKNALSQLKR